METLNKLKKYYFLFFILIFALILLSINIDKPFIGHHDWNGAFWGSSTRRYLRYLGIIHNQPGSSVYLQNLFYIDYTPFLPLTFTFFTAIFGLSEASLRLAPLTFSALMLFFIYKIGKTLFNKSVGYLAAIFAAITPMFLYFGKLPDHEPIVTSLVTITFYFYLKAVHKNKKMYYLFLLFLALSLLESWPAFFLIPPLMLSSVFLRKEKIKRVITPAIIALFVIVFQFSLIIYFKGIQGLFIFFSQGLTRINLSAVASETIKFNSLQFISTESHYVVIYFTRLLIISSFLWLVILVWKIKKRKTSASDWYLIILFSYAFLFILVFQQLAYIHDYKLYHFLPFITLSAASFWYLFFSKLENFLGEQITKKVKFQASKFFIIILIIFLVGTERLVYLSTLLKTSFNMPGYELGNLIRANTGPQDTVLVDSRQFKGFFEVFVDYYSDRRVDYGDINLEEFKKQADYKKYKYIILIDERTEDPSLESYLEATFLSKRFGPYQFFELGNKI